MIRKLSDENSNEQSLNGRSPASYSVDALPYHRPNDTWVDYPISTVIDEHGKAQTVTVKNVAFAPNVESLHARLRRSRSAF